MKPYKVFLCEYIHPKALAMLEARAEVVTDPTVADAAINRNLRMDRAWMERCPNLKAIGVHGTGTDGVDLQAAAELGIRVINAPGENADSVAELIVAFALMLSRHLSTFDREIRSGAVLVSGGGTLVGRELRGRVFGMIGCGNIARKAARILREGFGMETAGYSTHLTPERAGELGIGYCASVQEVLERSDIISIGTPLTDSTRNLLDAQMLSHAKPGAILINTARGGIVNEDALYDALTTGRLAAAACDVFTQEPPTMQNKLVALSNFLATPHIGAATDEALYRVSTSTVRQTLAVLDNSTDDDIHWVVK